MIGTQVVYMADTLGRQKNNEPSQRLTLYKIYNIIKYRESPEPKAYHPHILLENDIGDRVWYDIRRFLTIDEWRERQIEKII